MLTYYVDMHLVKRNKFMCEETLMPYPKIIIMLPHLMIEDVACHSVIFTTYPLRSLTVIIPSPVLSAFWKAFLIIPCLAALIGGCVLSDVSHSKYNTRRRKLNMQQVMHQSFKKLIKEKYVEQINC